MKKYLSLVLVFNVMLLNFAQQKDSLKIENKRFDFQYKKLYVPAALMVSGIIADGNGRESLKNEMENQNSWISGLLITIFGLVLSFAVPNLLANIKENK